MTNYISTKGTNEYPYKYSLLSEKAKSIAAKNIIPCFGSAIKNTWFRTQKLVCQALILLIKKAGLKLIEISSNIHGKPHL